MAWTLVLLQACAQAQTTTPPDNSTLFKRAFGQRQKSAAQQIALPVWVDDQEMGLVKAEILGRHVELERRGLANTLKPLLQARVLAQVAPADGSSPRITLEDLRLLGLEVNYSVERLVLEIGIPLALRAVQSLSLKARAEEPSYEIGQRVLPQPWSFIGNLRGSMSLQDASGNTSQYGRLQVDTATRWHDWVLEGSGTLSSTESTHSFSRQDIRLVRDWAPQAVRLALGDVTATGQSGGSSLALGGVRVTRLFGLNPALATQALPDTTLALAKGASVDVSVNGMPSSTLRLGPGVYRLSDLPVFAGANAIDLTITEPDGRITRRSLDYFFNASLLKPGLHEYDLALGYPLVASSGTNRSYDTGQRMLSAWWRHGWSDSVTAGISLQARTGGTMQARLTGAEAVWATPIGDFASWLAQSRHSTFGGQAASLQWRWTRATQEHSSYGLAATVQGSQYGEGFASVSSDLPGPPVRDVGLRLSLLWADGWRGNLGASRRINARTGDLSSEVSMSLQRRINRQWSVDTTLARRQLNQEDDRSIAVLLSHSGSSLGNGKDAGSFWQNTVSLQSQDQRLQWDGMLNGQSTWLGSDTNWQLGASRATARSGQTSSLQMRGLSGRAEGGLFVSDNSSGSGSTRMLEATLASAVVASADGGWSWSSPVNDSAVQFKPYKGYEGLKLLVDPQADRAALTSDRFGTPALANLSAYVPRELQLDFEDLPSGRNMGVDRPMLLPAHRSVLVVPVGSNATTQARGRLIGGGGQPLSLQSLMVFDQRGAKVMDLFTNRKGQFTSSQLPPGRYALKRAEDEAELASFVVEDSDEGILDIGTVQLKGDQP